MSMTLNGSTQWAHRAISGSPVDYCVAAWVRRDTDSGGREFVVRFPSAGATGLEINASDELVGRQGFTLGPAAMTFTTGVWRWVMFRYIDGTLRYRTCDDGGSAWATLGEATGTSDQTLSDFAIGNGATGSADLPMPGTFASYKIWLGTLPTEAEVLTERLNTDVTVTAGLFAAYDFLDGELATDRSGSSLDLTLVGTPTYTADKPDDLTIGTPPEPAPPRILISFRPPA
jgi:hypothetical protein